MTVINLADYRPHMIDGVEIVVRDGFFMGKLPQQAEFSFMGPVDMIVPEFFSRIDAIKDMHDILTEHL